MDVTIDVVAGTVRPITVPATSTNTSVLPGDSYICGWALQDASAEFPTSAEGSVTAPAAGATVAVTGVVPSGEYDISWTVSLEGAAAVADTDNFALFAGATQIATSVNAGLAGNYAQPEVTAILAANETLSVKAIGAGTAGVEYSADISADPANEIVTRVNIMDGTRVVAALSMKANDNDSRSLGEAGWRIYTGISLAVLSGSVQGSIGARFLRAC